MGGKKLALFLSGVLPDKAGTAPAFNTRAGGTKGLFDNGIVSSVRVLDSFSFVSNTSARRCFALKDGAPNVRGHSCHGRNGSVLCFAVTPACGGLLEMQKAGCA